MGSAFAGSACEVSSSCAAAHASTPRIEQLARNIENAEPQLERKRHRDPWVAPFSRVAAALGKGELGTTAAREQLSERAGRGRRKLKNGAARDLLVCAILLGALVYARAAALEVNAAFFVLGGLATLLLLGSVGLRLQLERRLIGASARLAEAVARRVATPASGGLSHCRICRETQLSRASGDELGPRLVALGVVEVFVCPRCGHVTGAGAARPPAA
ncbi:MAG: hypothetical protein QM756_00755 [Polyangiaceae bacterium]